MPFLDVMDRTLFGASLMRWLLAAATLFGAYLALALLRRWVLHRVGKLAARTATSWDDLAVEIIERTRPYFIFVLALEAASRVVPLKPGVSTILRAALVIAGLLQAGVWGNGIIGFAADRYTKLKTTGDLASRATVSAIGYVARLALWIVLAVTALDFFNVRVTALLTGLGIGGIAVALALQNILGDLFAAIAIVLDRPFVVGDSVVVGDVQGDIEHVGLKTTRIRAVGGEQVVMANSDLLKSRIRNYGRMEQRRVAFHLDVTYDTPPDTVARIPGIIRGIIEQQTTTRFERCHFLTFADSSLRIEAVYFVLDREYKTYADIQQAINLELLRHFAVERIEFAFPSRTVLLRHEDHRPEGPPARDNP